MSEIIEIKLSQEELEKILCKALKLKQITFTHFSNFLGNPAQIRGIRK